MHSAIRAETSSPPLIDKSIKKQFEELNIKIEVDHYMIND